MSHCSGMQSSGKDVVESNGLKRAKLLQQKQLQRAIEKLLVAIFRNPGQRAALQSGEDEIPRSATKEELSGEESGFSFAST